METKVKVATDAQPMEELSIVRYAWGNEKLKTWFITKNKKAFVPKGSRLIFVLRGKPTSEPISISGTYPKTKDVICDVDGAHIEVVDVSWI